MTAILSTGIEQGLLFAFMVLGVFITFRILDFPDLTVDGSITTGAAVTAVMITTGNSAVVATLAGTVAGLFAGFVTGILHLLLKSGDDSSNYGPKLLAGILTMTALYSLNLRIMGIGTPSTARSNVPLLGESTVFERLESLLSVDLSGWTLIAVLAILALVVKLILDWFLHTEFGLTMQATGDNEQMIRALGVNTDFVRVLGLGLANAMVALSGSLIAQNQGFADIGMGIGTIVAGLAGVIVGEVLFGSRSVSWVLFSVIGGSIVYRVLIAAALRIEYVDPTDLRLLTAILVVAALATPAIRRKVVRM